MTSKNFALITAMTQAELTQKVNEHLAKGWHLQGDAGCLRTRHPVVSNAGNGGRWHYRHLT